jgi:hypothetical protein
MQFFVTRKVGSRLAIVLGTATSVLVVASLPLAAQWPGDQPSPGGALAARAIGIMCSDSLLPEELYDLDLYLAKSRLKSRRERRPYWEAIEQKNMPSLEAEYMAKYRNVKNCTPESTEEAKDMVERVRKYFKSRQPGE